MDKKYNIIYCDPPWHMNAGAVPHNNGVHTGIEDQYSTMRQDELMRLNIKALAAGKCVLFMWTICSHLPDAIQLMKTWGFEYKTVGFVWVKETRAGSLLSGLGYYTRIGSEFCLIGTRFKGNNLERINKGVPQLVFAPRTKHSEKPAIVRQRIVELYGDLPRIELFSRHVVAGWDRHGSDIGDIHDFVGDVPLRNIKMQCDKCGDIFEFTMQEGDDFECPRCGQWYNSEGIYVG